MGAWIETRQVGREDTGGRSHPMWVRGLKLVERTFFKPLAVVAPHVGAWIETFGKLSDDDLLQIAPHVGAWIETN